jgi:PKD repeat protein
VPHFLTKLWSTLGVLILVACSGGNLVLPNEQAPSAIRVVKGDGQTGEVGEMLDKPLEVTVTDATGDPVHGATVVFELTSAGAGAAISPSPTTTDEAGRAKAQMLLGDKVGLQTGAAHVVVAGANGPSAPFTALASPAPPEHPEDPDNRAPDADYNWHCEGVSCQFTDASGDRDGAVMRWEWSFGDGGTSEEPNPIHRYPGSGRYEVTLTVTDNEGAADQSTAHVDVESD